MSQAYPNINNTDGTRSLYPHDSASDGALHGKEGRNGSGRLTDGDNEDPRPAEIDDTLGNFGNSPDVGTLDGNDDGNGTQVRGLEGPELIDRILECEETRGLYEDYGTLSVSSLSAMANRGRCEN
jgi:hypothetical protein